MAQKRGRKPESTTPISALVLPKLEEMGLTISKLESEMGLTTDTIRNVLRGKTSRNRRDKVELLIRLASRLKIPAETMIETAKIPMPGGKDWDFGTREGQVKRITLAAGGNPAMCGTALGVMAARGEVLGLWGISRTLYFAGTRFADFFNSFSRMSGAPRSPDSVLASMMEDDRPRSLDRILDDAEREERDSIRVRIFRQSVKSLELSDRTSRLAFRPSFEVMRVAVNNILPGYIDQTEETERGRGQFSALVIGLSQLRKYYDSEDFARLYRQMNVD